MKLNDAKSNFELTKEITKHYQLEISPYELIVEAISNQNKQLYDLEKQYLQMNQTIKNLDYDPTGEEQILKNRRDQRIMERKLFAQEALIAKEQTYAREYQKKKRNQQSEINLMKELIQADTNNSINIFMNLEEGILNKLLEYCKNNKDQQSIGHIKYWKDTYSEAKRKIQESYH